MRQGLARKKKQSGLLSFKADIWLIAAKDLTNVKRGMNVWDVRLIFQAGQWIKQLIGKLIEAFFPTSIVNTWLRSDGFTEREA